MSICVCETCHKPISRKPSHIRQYNYCSQYCSRAGLRQRRQREIEQQFGEPIYDLLYRLYWSDNLGIKQIAKKIGVSDRNLWDWFDQLGIERRKRSDAVALQWKDNDERRNEMSQRTKQEFQSGKRDPTYIVKVAKTDWARKRNSESKQGEKNHMFGVTGPNNPHWKGGKIPVQEYGKEWRTIRKQVKERDGFRCRICGSVENLNTHHIKPFRDNRVHDMNNLTTLCGSCHNKVHSGKLANPSS